MNISMYLKKNKVTQKRFAKTLGVTEGAVWQWVTGMQRITAERALQIEKMTSGEITRHDLRPDIFETRT